MKSLTLLVSAVSLLTSLTGFAYEPSWDGNHPDSKSEAWTWMGHLNEMDSKGKLGRKGMGFIYYYTRNDTTGSMVGSLNFRSSSRTYTLDGIGQNYQMSTVYAVKEPNAELRSRRGYLDIEFNAGRINDRVVDERMNDADRAELANTMKLYPGLEIAPNFKPKKTSFHVVEKDGTVLDLNFYSIWPVLSAPEGKMKFLNQPDTYSFSDPMMVTVGTVGGKKMAGLSFLDRQWAKSYFGVHMLNNLGDLMKYAKAMNFAHTWSAFHARNERTGEYTFFHLWRQYRRENDQRDQQIDYSGMLYAKGGKEYGLISADDYKWTSSGYVQQQGTVAMMDYAMGRVGFFPSKAAFSSNKMGLSATMWASPHLQVLDQPIYFYEGYAEGEGTFRGDKVKLQGRLESSRMMFREKDYEEMLEILAKEKGDWKQPELATWLKANKKQDNPDSPFVKIHQKMIGFAAAFSDMGLKMAIFGDILNGVKPVADANDPDVMIYQ